MKGVRIAGAVFALCVLTTGAGLVAQVPGAEHWVGTWATAVVPRPQPAPGAAPGRGGAVLNFKNQTLRQVVHVSLGGGRVRVVLSNAFGTSPLAVGAAAVALRQKESSIAAGSSRPLTFSGSASTTIAAGAVAVSDPVALAIPALADLVVDVFLPGDTGASPSPLTTHASALQTNYLSAPVVTFGDSITDGTLSTPDTNNRWPDHLARRLLAAGGAKPQPMGVLNEGIAGNRILTDVIGPNALSRFDRDVLALSGVTHVILLEGINDLGLAADGQLPTAAEIVAGHRQLVTRAHAHGIKVLAGTVLPFEGTNLGAIAPNYYSAEKDTRRQAMNEAIRTGGFYDGIIDFEAAVRDQAQPKQLLARFKGADNLHLTDAGYKAMADAVNLTLLKR